MGQEAFQLEEKTYILTESEFRVIFLPAVLDKGFCYG